MVQIPKDATHWDSGDWISWHRSAKGLDERPCSAAAEADPMARLTALHVSLLRSAKTYFALTGEHLPVYDAIAEVYAAIHFDRPFGGDTPDETRVVLLHLAPYDQKHVVEIDLTLDFDSLIVVRINESFGVEARSLPRHALPDQSKGRYQISWKSMPAGS